MAILSAHGFLFRPFYVFPLFAGAGVIPYADGASSRRSASMGSEKKKENNVPYPVTIAHDFKEFLSVQNGKGEPAIVVGGHAASLWAH